MLDRHAALRIVPVLALAAACGHPEQSVVGQYFNAVNAKDEQTLSSFAVVGFDQKVDDWSIVETRPEARVPAPLPEFIKKVKAVEAQVAENKSAYSAYFNEHPVEVDEVRELLKKADAKIPARLLGHTEQWQGFTQKEKDLKKAVAEAKAAADREKKAVALSVGEVSDLDSLTGDMVTKELALRLTIEGQPKPYVMTLIKYELQPSSTGQRLMSRWVVHSVKPEG